MKLALISDTHGHEFRLPDADVLIHAGDLTMGGMEHQMADGLDWLAEQEHDHKILIAGNHDFFAEQDPDAMKKMCKYRGLIYLEDSGIVIDGVKFWGSPVQPWFYDWAFNRQRGPDIKQHWDMIPDNTDVLITHGPPYGILDVVTRGECVGCQDLCEAVERVRPTLHVFGHIHEARGSINNIHGVDYRNVSALDEHYSPYRNPAMLYEL